MPEFQHATVLLNETVHALKPKSGRTYLDGTGGGGGHTDALRQAAGPEARIITLDRDPIAVAHLEDRFRASPNVQVVQGNFFEAKAILEEFGICALDGVLLDLGVSSPQFDTAARGFSFHRDGPLDMRMNPELVSAAVWVNTLPEEKLREIICRYGEEHYATRIAAAITQYRENQPIATTLELAEIVSAAVPAAYRRDGHPARKTFMALRYFVNAEIDGLAQALTDLFSLLVPKARLAVIGFNSMEDAVIKDAFRPLMEGCTCPKEFPVCRCGRKPAARWAGKPITPTKEEIQTNPRARSAKLRVVEKL